MSEGEKGKNKTGAKFSLYTVSIFDSKQYVRSFSAVIKTSIIWKK